MRLGGSQSRVAGAEQVPVFCVQKIKNTTIRLVRLDCGVLGHC